MAKKSFSINIRHYGGRDPRKLAEYQRLLAAAARIEVWVRLQLVDDKTKTFHLHEIAVGAKVNDTDVEEILSQLGESSGFTR